ncbi:hypothetical protein Thiosp_00788 [Thiorhodovibrio litoralis]|nr:hypothetical protein Thiosp_00788 [Thiorhodovibrio litoralis]
MDVCAVVWLALPTTLPSGLACGLSQSPTPSSQARALKHLHVV